MEILVILAVVVFFGFIGLRIVKQQEVAIVETFGKYSRTLTPGLNWIFPGIQLIAQTLDLRIQAIPAHVEIKTADNMFVGLPVTLMVRVEPERAADAYYKLANPQEQIKTWVLNTMRSITANMELAHLFQDRDHLVSTIQSELVNRMSEYGYIIEGVLVDQPTVSPEVQAAFNRVVASKREKEAAEQEAEAKRIRIIGESKAEAESQMLRAQGLAQARKILAQGLSEAVKAAAANGVNEHDVLTLLMETNRLDTIKSAAEHGKLVVMDLRSTVPNPSLQINP